MAYKDAELYNSTEEKIIKDEKRVVGVQFDKFGKIIEGSGRIITDEEKNYLLDFLSKNGISINRKTYNAVLKRYLNGFISIDEEKKLILK